MIPLYRTDPYLSSCETIIDRVLRSDNSLAIFCREALFMEGGGQPMDHGTLTVGDETYPLLKIIKEKGNTGYVISPEAKFEKGAKVTCTLDFERRYKIMRMHSAQHAFAGALRMERKEILTGGMKISDSGTECTVLYPLASGLTDQDITAGLSRVSLLINEDRGVNAVSVTSETEAIDTYGELYRPTIASGLLKGTVRLIIIDGVDANACGGTHIKSLKEIGGIQLLKINEVPEGRELVISINS